MAGTPIETAHAGLVDAIRAGDAARVADAISTEWLDGSSRAGQPDPPSVWRRLAADLFAGFGKLEVDVADVRPDGDRLSARWNVAGTQTGTLWGLPATGKRTAVSATAKARRAGGKLAVAFEDVVLLPTLRAIGVVPMPEAAYLPPVHPVSLPEVIMKIVFNGGVLEKPCSHLDGIRVHEPAVRACDECVKASTAWPALRMCVTCGQVGCCDVSINKHALKHSEGSGHPLIRSIHREESWMWCYVDKTILSARW